MNKFDGNYERLKYSLNRIRGNENEAPDASVVIPVNAQGDLKNLLNIVDDLSQYSGKFYVEIVPVINNYPEDSPPPEIKKYNDLGLRIVSIPYLRKKGEAIGFTARIPGLEFAKSENTILFDSDCRIPNATKLINWYVENYNRGTEVAYTHVAYYDLRKKLSVKVRIWIHHFSRWVKREVLGIPTVRGSNYAIKRSLILDLYSQGLLADDMNVGPVAKSVGAKIAYSGHKDLVVFTSGRMFSGSWIGLFKYLIYRLKYNLRVLPVSKDAAKHTNREEDKDRKFIDNRLVD